jgi:hypothetical protein
MTKNLTDWETLERDETRGFETIGIENENGWEIEVRFDDATESRTTDRTPTSREEAIQTGRELAKMD